MRTQLLVVGFGTLAATTWGCGSTEPAQVAASRSAQEIPVTGDGPWPTHYRFSIKGYSCWFGPPETEQPPPALPSTLPEPEDGAGGCQTGRIQDFGINDFGVAPGSKVIVRFPLYCEKEPPLILRVMTLRYVQILNTQGKACMVFYRKTPKTTPANFSPCVAFCSKDDAATWPNDRWYYFETQNLGKVSRRVAEKAANWDALGIALDNMQQLFDGNQAAKDLSELLKAHSYQLDALSDFYVAQSRTDQISNGEFGDVFNQLWDEWSAAWHSLDSGLSAPPIEVQALDAVQLARELQFSQCVDGLQNPEAALVTIPHYGPQLWNADSLRLLVATGWRPGCSDAECRGYVVCDLKDHWLEREWRATSWDSQSNTAQSLRRHLGMESMGDFQIANLDSPRTKVLLALLFGAVARIQGSSSAPGAEPVTTMASPEKTLQGAVFLTAADVLRSEAEHREQTAPPTDYSGAQEIYDQVLAALERAGFWYMIQTE